jgi:hypothetical protein
MTCNRFCAAVGLALLFSAAHAAPVYDVKFENFTVGNPIPSGEAGDRPFDIDTNLIHSVENAGTIAGATLPSGNFARLGEAPGIAPALIFDRNISFTTGIVHVGMDLLYETEDSYLIGFRNGRGSLGGSLVGSANQNVADLFFGGPSGALSTFLPGTGSRVLATVGYGTAFRFDGYFDMDADNWDAFINGTEVASDIPFEDLGTLLTEYQLGPSTSDSTLPASPRGQVSTAACSSTTSYSSGQSCPSQAPELCCLRQRLRRC